MAQVVHSREEYEALGRDMKPDQWREGIAVWNPKRDRAVRKEKNKRVCFQLWPASLAERAINAVTYLKRTSALWLK